MEEASKTVGYSRRVKCHLSSINIPPHSIKQYHLVGARGAPSHPRRMVLAEAGINQPKKGRKQKNIIKVYVNYSFPNTHVYGCLPHFGTKIYEKVFTLCYANCAYHSYLD